MWFGKMMSVPIASLFAFAAVLCKSHALVQQSVDTDELQHGVQEMQSSGQANCPSFTGVFNFSKSNLSKYDSRFTRNFQLQAVLKNESQSCSEKEQIFLGCYWTVQECMLKAWAQSKRVFMYGVSEGPEGRGGECWVSTRGHNGLGGDECVGGFVDNPNFNVITVMNLSVAQPTKVEMALFAAGVRPFALPNKFPNELGYNRWITEAVMGLVNWKMSTALYRTKHENECVLGFGGADVNYSLEDVSGYLEAAQTTEVCGFSLNGYVVDSLQNRLNTSTFRRFFEPVLKDTCNGITVVGEGLGGAVAEAFAACVNNGYGWSFEGGFVQGGANFDVKAVYTIGAPRIGTGVIRNNKSPTDGCFDGKRIFIEGDVLVDQTNSGSSHPLMEWMMISEKGENYAREYSNETKGCTTEQTYSNPPSAFSTTKQWDLSYSDKILFRLVNSL